MSGWMTSRLLMLLIFISDVSAYIELIGAGATVPSGVYVTWMAAYKSSRAPFADVRLTYRPLGSGSGKRAIASRSVHYAGSDSLLSDEEYEENPDLQMFPSIALLVPRFLSLRHHHHHHRHRSVDPATILADAAVTPPSPK